MMLIIINKKDPKNHPSHTIKKYCGRGSALGNEFSHLQKTSHESVYVKDRDQACDLMRVQLLKYLLDSKNMFPKSKKIKEAFNEIYRLHIRGEVVALECYCKNRDDANGINVGQRCHTEDIKYIIEKLEDEMKNGRGTKENVSFVLSELLKEFS